MFSTNRATSIETIKKILIIQFRPFGDVLLATSYLEALQKRFPDAAIDFLVKKPYHHILYKNPWIYRVIALEQHGGVRYITNRFKLFADIRNQCYDLIIDQQNGTGSGQVVFFSKAKLRLGWVNGKWNRAYNLKAKKGPTRYRSFQNFDMLEPLGISERSHRLFYYVKQASLAFAETWMKDHQMHPAETIIISPGSPREKKKWNINNYSELIEKIGRKTKMQVMVLWGPQEYDDAYAVFKRSQGLARFAPPTDFNQAAAFLKKSRLLICNDGGINHLSVALGVPSLAVFGNTSPDMWSAQGYFPKHYHLFNPERKQGSDNNFGITPGEAFRKVASILTEI